MKIDELIEKYYQGETSPEEELFLKSQVESIIGSSPELDMFSYFEDESELALPDDFDEKLFAKIEQSEKISGKIGKSNSRWRLVASIAASLLIVLSSAWFGYEYFSPKQGLVITDANLDDKKELAIEEVEIAFSKISTSFEKADEKILKLNYINKSYEIIDFLNTLNGYE